MMKQLSLTCSGFERKIKPKREFLDQMQRAVPRDAFLALIAPHAPTPGPKGGRPPFALQTLLSIHLLQQWLNLSVQVIGGGRGFMLRQGTVVDATLIAAPSSTKNSTRSRDPEMVSGDESELPTTKQVNPWDFGMKARIGVDADTGLVHTVGTSFNVHDVTQTNSSMGAVLQQLERIKARTRAKAEHPFHIVINLFGYRKTRYHGLAKNTAQLMTLFALANVWLARKWMLNNDTRSASAA